MLQEIYIGLLIFFGRTTFIKHVHIYDFCCSYSCQEEYLNLDTLERRLHMLIRRYPANNHNQQLSHTNSSVGTMIPTPGFQQTGNSSLTGTSSLDSSLVAINSSNTIASSTVNSGSFFPTRNGSSGSMHGGYSSSSDGSFVFYRALGVGCFFTRLMKYLYAGSLTGGYQQQSNAFMVNTGGMNMGTSMGAQRMTSQMIPTPGISNSNNNNNDINNANNNNLMNVELSNDVKPTIASQPVLQKQQLGGQSSHILHNIGGHMSGGIRSSLQQKSFGVSNAPLNGGMGMMAKNMPVMNGSGITEGYSAGTIYGNSAKSISQHFDQHHQRPVTQGILILPSLLGP